MTIDADGMITDGPLDGFYVLPLAIASRDSSHDFPSFVGLIGLSHLWNDEAPMHPRRSDAERIASHIAFDHLDEGASFVDNFPLNWDT